MFVFVDETGADRRNTLRKYGYSTHDRPLTFLVRGIRVSAIACMSTAGLLDHTGTVDSEVFYSFYRLTVNALQWYQSTVILDNLFNTLC